MDWLPPEPLPLNRLELLALELVPELGHLGFNARCAWLRRYLRSEIAKRRAGPGREGQSVTLTCSICGGAFTRAKPKAKPVCEACLRPSFDPGPREIAWVEKIPDERLDELAGALALLR